MTSVQIFNLSGVNNKLSPLLQKGGELLLAVNADCYNQGGKKKRPGYTTFLGTSTGATVNSLFDWQRNNGTQFWLYKASGSLLEYSTQGTGAWTVCGNGTIGAGAHVGHAILNDILFVGDGVGTLRFSSNGTSFTSGSIAPIGEYLENYQNRIYVGGTVSVLFYSSANDGTNWVTSGTSDSSSLNIPGAGKINGLFRCADRLNVPKNSREMYRWDGYSVVDTSTNLGPSSPYSIAPIEDYRFYLNREGIFGYGGSKPEIISNPIEKFFYNDLNTAVLGTVFNSAPGGAYYYDYFVSLGSVKDDLTQYQYNNMVLDYDYRFNEWKPYDFTNKPTAFCTFNDVAGAKTFIFGDATGQCYKYDPTATSDNGNPIPFIIMGFIHGSTLLEKKWLWFRAQLNPGNEARIQVAISDSFTPTKLKWTDLGDCSDGVVTYRFPEGSRGKFLFWKISENSTNNRCEVLGIEFDAKVIEK